MLTPAEGCGSEITKDPIERTSTLTCNSYDGEADDPAPLAKEETARVAPEPEPMHPEPEPEQFQPEAADDFNIKTEPNQGFEGMQNIQGFQNGQQDHTEEYDRPISIKEDGYVLSVFLC